MTQLFTTLDGVEGSSSIYNPSFQDIVLSQHKMVTNVQSNGAGVSSDDVDDMLVDSIGL